MLSGVARFLKCKLIYLGGILMSPIPSYSDLFQAKLMSVHSCNKIIQNLCHISSLSLSTVQTLTSPGFLAQTTCTPLATHHTADSFMNLLLGRAIQSILHRTTIQRKLVQNETHPQPQFFQSQYFSFHADQSYSILSWIISKEVQSIFKGGGWIYICDLKGP